MAVARKWLEDKGAATAGRSFHSGDRGMNGSARNNRFTAVWGRWRFGFGSMARYSVQ